MLQIHSEQPQYLVSIDNKGAQLLVMGMGDMGAVGPPDLPHTCNISCGNFSPVQQHALSHPFQALA